MWFISHVNTYSLEATHTLETQDERVGSYKNPPK